MADDKIGKTGIGSPNCPCVVAERPECGRSDCWHFGFNRSDCDLCHKTGFVAALRSSPPTATTAAQRLARMALQSDRYSTDADFREAVNAVLAEVAPPTATSDRTRDGHCLKCGEFVGRTTHAPDSLLPCPAAPTQEGELEGLLDRFHIAAQKLNLAPHLVRNSVTANAVTIEYRAARSRVTAKYEQVVRERNALREFAEHALGEWSWGWSIPDGGSMQDKAEKLGLIVKVPADEAFRNEYDADEMFVCAWSPLASRLTAGSPEQEQK